MPLDPDILQNWDFLGRCYNILKIDPLRIEDGAMLESAFSTDTNDFDETADRRYRKPNWTSYIPVTGGKNETRSATMSSAYDFQTFNKVQGSVSASDVTGNLFKTTLSGSYSSTASMTGSKEHIVTYVTQTVNLYKLALADGNLTKLSEGLRTAVAGLPNREALSYDGFIKQFGTHYSTNVLFGGCVYQRISVDQSEYSSLLEEGVDVRSEVTATFSMAKGEVRAGAEDKRSKKFVNAVRNSTDEIVYVGGLPQTMFDIWASFLESRPAPIQIELSPLYTLLTPALFPNDSDILKRRELLRGHTEKYLSSCGSDVEGAVVRFKDKAKLRLAARGIPRFLSWDENRRRVKTQARPAHHWLIVGVHGSGGDQRVRTGDTVLLQSPDGSYLDAQSGADEVYEAGSGLTALSRARQDSPAVRWKLVLADNRRRTEIVEGDYVRLQSEWENEDTRFGYLKGEIDGGDPNQRVFSFGKPSDAGTIWRLDRAI